MKNQVIILAAGKGTRMASELPKALVELHGRPMIKYLIDSVKAARICDRPILVVSPDNQEIISRTLAEYDLDYIVQPKPLGTGHAVNCAQQFLADPEIENIIVFYGDHPFIKSDTMRDLVKSQTENQSAITILTTAVENFSGWQKNFWHWGRIVRQDQAIKEIVEFKDATASQQEICEVNPAIYCFGSAWLWSNISKIENNNNNQEYYLTDLIKLATSQNIKINSLVMDPTEAVGVNSLEELAVAESLIIH